MSTGKLVSAVVRRVGLIVSGSPGIGKPMAPDLILILTDQQRADQVGYASDGYFETPNLDRLAARGIVFANAYSGSTTCVPARVSLLTGLHHHRVPTQVNWFALREGFWTIARGLSQAGYQTALVGKGHFAPVHARHGFDTMRLCEHLGPGELRGDAIVDDYHGWLMAEVGDDWRDDVAPHASRTIGLDIHPTTWVKQEAIALLERRDRTKPLFLAVSFPHPHAPYNPPEPYASMYDHRETALPADGFEVNERLPIAFRDALTSGFPPFPTWRVDADPLRARNWLTRVRALVKQIDDAVGAILEHIDLTSSVVVFTSDHGDYGGHRGLLKKVPWIPFDDLARVPLVVAGHGVTHGRHLTQLVQSSDFAPTCLDFAGGDVRRDAFDAHSLRPLLNSGRPGEAANRTVVCATTMGWPMIRRGSLKYVVHRDSGTGVLFDVDADAGETINVLDDPAYSSDADELCGLLDAELARPTPACRRLEP